MKLLIGNFKGPKGETGSKGEKGDTGDTGETGQRGSRWTSGTSITGTSTIGVKFPDSGITDAQLFDYYINTDTGNLYECTVPGTADVAEWVHLSNFKGPKGDTGPAGSISDINDQKPTYSEADILENIVSGETVKTAFGKLKKAISVLIAHYTQKATQSILGHVKLSNSAAITTTGEYALDAVEKNASVEGTLANLIGQVNSNFTINSYNDNDDTVLNIIKRNASHDKIFCFNRVATTKDAPNVENWDYIYIVIPIEGRFYMVQAYRAYTANVIYQRFINNADEWFDAWFEISGRRLE